MTSYQGVPTARRRRETDDSTRYAFNEGPVMLKAGQPLAVQNGLWLVPAVLDMRHTSWPICAIPLLVSV